MVDKRSALADLLCPDAFLWATGIEDTFVFAPHAATGRTLDEYELTLHYDKWEADLSLVAELGVPAARYGLPWYKVEPRPGVFDWDFADKTLARLLDSGVQPIVDLVHYGTPAWMADSFLNPDFPRHMAAYARAVAERFKGRVRWYTPLNEPRITAHYCGRLGWWPPYHHGWKGLVRVLLAVCRGIIHTDRALAEVDPEIIRLHVDATDLYETEDPALFAIRDFKHALVFLPIDLITGRMTPENPLCNWLIKQGATPSELSWFEQNALKPDLLGINLYPMFSRRRIERLGNRTQYRALYGTGELVKDVARMYWERYAIPLVISETASRGTVERRMRWLSDSVAAVKELRVSGIPVVGYTWWPMFSLIGWGYREGDLPFHKYIVKMGLWDLKGDGLERVRTPLVDEYKRFVADGPLRVGRLCV